MYFVAHVLPYWAALAVAFACIFAGDDASGRERDSRRGASRR